MAFSAALLDGPFRSADARRAGIHRSRLERLLLDDVVRQVLFGVYLPTTALADVAARAAAVALALPSGAAVCRSTAAWLHGIDTRPPGAHTSPPPLECLVPVGVTPVRRPGVVCYASDLPDDDVVLTAGTPLTSPERTALDMARWSERHVGLAALDAFAHAGLLAQDALVARLERLRGERFAARARALVDYCEPSAESAGESWLRLRLLDAGLPRPAVQVPLRAADGRELYRLDTGYEEFRIAPEYDGLAFHGMTQAQQAADLRRRERIAAEFGWTAIGFTAENVLAARPAVERVVAEMIGWSHSLRPRAW